MNRTEYLKSTGEILSKVRILAKKYYSLTGRPLGVAGEVAEYEVIKLLKLNLSPVRQPGYDAIRKTKKGIEKIQIKGRVIHENSKPGQRIGSIKLNTEWDFVFLVILNNRYETVEIYEAPRKKIEKELKIPGSIARNVRGQLSVNKFISIGHLIYKKK